jgi:hypothetical protein
MARRLWSVHRVRNSMINWATIRGFTTQMRTTPCCEVLPVEMLAATAAAELITSSPGITPRTIRPRDRTGNQRIVRTYHPSAERE